MVPHPVGTRSPAGRIAQGLSFLTGVAPGSAHNKKDQQKPHRTARIIGPARQFAIGGRRGTVAPTISPCGGNEFICRSIDEGRGHIDVHRDGRGRLAHRRMSDLCLVSD